MNRELLQQALDALEVLLNEWTPAREAQIQGTAAITALREALAAPAPAVPDGLVEAVAKAIYWEWRIESGYVPWVDGGNSLKQDDARKIARAVIAGAAPAVREPQPLTKELLQRHAMFAADAPPASAVVLLSSLHRLLGIGGGGNG